MSLWNLFGMYRWLIHKFLSPLKLYKIIQRYISSLVLGEYEDWVLLVQGKNMIIDGEVQ